ncbi:MAG: iron-containing alcohol dehydrogenase [Oscillospiraceae bacterium]|jgi:hypothetical protein
MQNFQLNLPTKIIFGKDTEALAGKEAAAYGKRVLLHYGGESAKKYGVYDKVVSSLKENGLEIFELGGVMPNPRLTTVYEGIEIVRKNDIDFILAVGGGSVIDSAKAISVGAPYNGDVWDFYDYKATPEKSIPIGTVLTIAAAGSESSNSSVISNTQKELKRGLTSELLYPKFSILNPENTYTLPFNKFNCGACDILAHLMERYFVNERHVDVTDRLIEGVCRSLIENSKKVFTNPRDYNIRAEIMLAGCFAHNGILDVGRGGDWASHGIEHELSAIYDIPHGAGLSIIFPAWMKKVSQTNPIKIIQFGKRVFDLYGSSSKILGDTIEALEDFFLEMDLPIRLIKLLITEKHFETMARKAIEAGGGDTIGSYVKLNYDDVLEIYRLAR